MTPFKSANPQTFKLRIVWGFELKEKMTAEFSDSSWIPRVNETMILPIDEEDELDDSQRWYKFKVERVAYDFQNQMTRVICKAIEPLPQKKLKEIVLTAEQKALLEELGSEVELRRIASELKRFNV